jgi:hypothetical protein
VVSATNSLVGAHPNDSVGASGITALTNGNYVVTSTSWDTATVLNAGAVTWGSGTAGVAGAVSSANSLVGSTADDQVGIGFVTALTNGNYVVASPLWNNLLVVDAGAATWGNGAGGTVGAITSVNSLVGSLALDSVGNDGVTPLSNGNYVVGSESWDNGAMADVGAVTWGNGSNGRKGAVSVSNSLVGSTTLDAVGRDGVTALTTGDYVVVSAVWNNGSVVDAGAVTGPTARRVSSEHCPLNSLVGSNRMILSVLLAPTNLRATASRRCLVAATPWSARTGTTA